jgi:hypothetical protein
MVRSFRLNYFHQLFELLYQTLCFFVISRSVVKGALAEWSRLLSTVAQSLISCGLSIGQSTGAWCRPSLT